MTQKSRSNKKQLDRFKEAARELECDESDDALERAFEGIDPKKKNDKAAKKSENK